MEHLPQVQAYFGMAPMDGYDDDITATTNATPVPRAVRSYGGAVSLRRHLCQLAAATGATLTTRAATTTVLPPAASATPTSRAAGPASSTTCAAVWYRLRARCADPRRTGMDPPDGGAVRRRQPTIEDLLLRPEASKDHPSATASPVIMDSCRWTTPTPNGSSTSRPAVASRAARLVRQRFRHWVVPCSRRPAVDVQRGRASPGSLGRGFTQLPVAQPGGRPITPDSVGRHGRRAEWPAVARRQRWSAASGRQCHIRC